MGYSHIYILLTWLVILLATTLNANAIVSGDVGGLNLLISILMLLFWIVLFYKGNREKTFMIYATVFWGITFVFVVLMFLETNITLIDSILYLAVFPIIGPLAGLAFISNFGLMISVAIISLLFTSCGIFLILKNKRIY